MKLVTAEQMRRIEEDAFSYGVSQTHMMRQVALTVTACVQKILDDSAYDKIVILCGSGQNGQDALLAAFELCQSGAKVHVFAVGVLPQTSTMPNGTFNLTYIKDKSGLDELKETLRGNVVVIDGLFGIGLSRPLDGVISEMISIVNAVSAQSQKMRVISVDIPSGLHADSGTVMGNCIVADKTIACGLGKLGLFQNSGPLYTGEVSFCDIGLPPSTFANIKAELINRDLAKRLLPYRSPLICKNGFGKALIVGGSINYIGAPLLAATGAAKSGVGITTLAQPKSIYLATASNVPFATHLPCADADGHFKAEAALELAEHFKEYDAMAIGCGVAPDDGAFEFMWQCLCSAGQTGLKTIIDAGALHMLAQKENPFSELPDDAVLTPHAGEMSRLTGLPADYIAQNKIAVALEYAQKWHKIVLLKGPNTVVAAPNGQFYVSSFAYSLLAVGGTGDVLSGSIAALAAQGLGLFDASALAVYMQGEAARICSDSYMHRGITPDQLAAFIPQVFAELEKD